MNRLIQNKILRRKGLLMDAEGGAAESGGYQTTIDQQGNESSAEEESPAQSGEDWSEYIDTGESEPESWEASEGTEEGTGEEESPATPSGEDEGPAEKEGEQEQQEESQEEEAGESEGEEQEEQPAETPEDIQERYRQSREQVVENLRENYKLDEDSVDKLLENPNEVLPDMAARLFADTVEASLQLFQQQLPNMLEAHEQQKQTKQRGEEEFYSQWPKLQEHKGKVERIAAAYRHANPNASREDFIRDVGAQAHWALGIPVEDQAQGQQQEQPYAPASPGGRTNAGQPGATPSPSNEFEQMHEEDYE